VTAKFNEIVRFKTNGCRRELPILTHVSPVRMRDTDVALMHYSAICCDSEAPPY